MPTDLMELEKEATDRNAFADECNYNQTRELQSEPHGTASEQNWAASPKLATSAVSPEKAQQKPTSRCQGLQGASLQAECCLASMQRRPDGTYWCCQHGKHIPLEPNVEMTVPSNGPHPTHAQQQIPNRCNTGVIGPAQIGSLDANPLPNSNYQSQPLTHSQHRSKHTFPPQQQLPAPYFQEGWPIDPRGHTLPQRGRRPLPWTSNAGQNCVEFQQHQQQNYPHDFNAFRHGALTHLPLGSHNGSRKRERQDSGMGRKRPSLEDQVNAWD